MLHAKKLVHERQRKNVSQILTSNWTGQDRQKESNALIMVICTLKLYFHITFTCTCAPMLWF